MAEKVARPTRYDGQYAASCIDWDVMQLLKRHRYGYVRPMEVAKTIGCTRAEAYMSLRYFVCAGIAGKREFDGRFYLVNDAGGQK